MVDYCFKWNYADNCPGEPLTADAALARHRVGEEYTAVLPPGSENAAPVLVTVVRRTGVVVVTFLDGPGRKATEYTFMQRSGECLFLTRVHIWDYPDEQPGRRLSEACRHETLLYREAGAVKRTLKDKTSGHQETTKYVDVPVAANWEPMPEFGDYRSIARYERDG